MKSVFLAVIVLSCRAFGKNDWTKACVSGTCSYDLEESPTSMGGAIEISGSPSAISDITTAAGWQILNCTDSTNNQTIRLVCTDESMGCTHIFQEGAVETIVRLPQDCGSGPFVRVANHWIPDDQSLPSVVASNLTRGDNTIPQVHILEIDDNFERASGLHGIVSFAIIAQGNMHADAQPEQRKRQSDSGSETVPVSFSELFVLFNDNLACPNGVGGTFTQSFLGEVTLDATFTISINMIASGTLVPTASVTLLSFSALHFKATTANIQATVAFLASLQGSVTALGQQLVNVVFPGFLIDGIITIQPSFVVTGDSAGAVQLQSSFSSNIGFSFEVSNLQFSYPSNSPPATVAITTPTVPFDSTMSPNVGSNALFAVNIIPELIVQVSAFSQFAELSVSFNLENSVEMDAEPTTGNNEEICVEFSNSFMVQVANSGPFFSALGPANTQTIAQGEKILLNVRRHLIRVDAPSTGADLPPPTTDVHQTCQIAVLGPSPPTTGTRRARSSFYSRDTFSCPPLAAVPQGFITFGGNA